MYLIIKGLRLSCMKACNGLCVFCLRNKILSLTTFLILTFLFSNSIFLIEIICQSKINYQVASSSHFSLMVGLSKQTNELLTNCEKAYRYVEGYGIKLPQKIRGVAYGTTQEFVKKSGGKYYNLAVARGEQIHLQPAYLLAKKGTNIIDNQNEKSGLQKTLVHELVHIGLSRQAEYLPCWFNEGLALVVSEEETTANTKFVSIKQIEQALKQSNYDKLRSAYSYSQRAVRKLVATYGKEKIITLGRSVSGTNSFENNFIKLVGVRVEKWFAENLKLM